MTFPFETGRKPPTELWKRTVFHHPKEVVSKLESIYDCLKAVRRETISRPSTNWAVEDIQKQANLSMKLEAALPTHMTIVDCVHVLNSWSNQLYCTKYWHVVKCVRVLSAHWKNGGHDERGIPQNPCGDRVQMRKEQLGWKTRSSVHRQEVKSKALESFLGLPMAVRHRVITNLYDGLLAIDQIFAMAEGVTL